MEWGMSQRHSAPPQDLLCSVPGFPLSKYCILSWKSEWEKPGSWCIDSFWCHLWLANRGFPNVFLNWPLSWLYSLSSFWLSYEERQRSAGFSSRPARNLHAFLKTFASLWWAYLDIEYDIFPFSPLPISSSVLSSFSFCYYQEVIPRPQTEQKEKDSHTPFKETPVTVPIIFFCVSLWGKLALRPTLSFRKLY